VDAPSVKLTLTSAPLQATTLTHHDTSAKALLPRVVYHTGAATELDDINNPIILNVSILLVGSTSDADTHLFDIGNNTDIIVEPPWLTSRDRVTRELTNIELQCVHNGRLFSFIATLHRHAPTIILALMTPPTSERATWATTLPPPRNIWSPASRDHHTNTLNPTDTTDKISEHLRQATLQQQELYTIVMAIADGMVAQAWSLDQSLLLFGGHLYLSVVSSLWSNLLQVLSWGVSANMELLALGAH
jgi:hypothetical protein